MSLVVERKSPSALTQAEIGDWVALLGGAPAYASPFFRPEFAIVVAAERPDAEVAILRRPGGERVGFFAYHRRPGGVLRPIGAPYSDWSGPVLAPDAAVEPEAFARALGADALRLDRCADPFGRFAGLSTGEDVCNRIDLAGGHGAYLAWRSMRHAKHVKNVRRCARKAEREVGPIGFRFRALERGVFDQLVAWKRAQYAATRLFDVLGPRWFRNVLWRLVQREETALRACVSTLTLGDRIVAIELHLRAGSVLHSWFPAYDRAFYQVSPGHLLIERIIEEGCRQGVTAFDLGPGESDFKQYHANAVLPMADVLVHGTGAMGAMRRASAALLAKAPETVQRARRRFEQIVSAEPEWTRAAAALAASALEAPRILARSRQSARIDDDVSPDALPQPAA